MKMKEITELSMDELLTKRRDLRQESLHLRLQQQSGQLEQPSRLRLLRRDIARLETVLSQRAEQTSSGRLSNTGIEPRSRSPSAKRASQRRITSGPSARW